MAAKKKKGRILTGIRPTGPLHLGHYVGALQQWIKLEDQFDCFFLIADAQALTDHAYEPELIRQSVFEVALDWLAVGLDPNRSAFTVQSWIPETFELEHLLASITPWSWVTRNPTLKAEIKQLEEQRGVTLTAAFVRYVVSQAADILIVAGNDNKTPILVPVGEDQLPHIELTRKIARTFNNAYGNVFPEPKSRVGTVTRLVGTDGSDKMSKSLGNVIMLSDTPEEVQRKVMGMFTDPKRIRADTPGTVEGNPVFIYHDAFNPDHEQVAEFKERYRKGMVGDVEVKRALANAINQMLDPIRERRAYFEQRPQEVYEYLVEGTRREKRIAKQTMQAVKEAMGLNYHAFL